MAYPFWLIRSWSKGCELARLFVTDFDFPPLLSSSSPSPTMDPTTTKNHHHHIQLLVDAELGDPFEKEYALYLVQDCIIAYIAEPKDCS
jgi:hypothetical protein